MEASLIPLARKKGFKKPQENHHHHQAASNDNSTTQNPKQLENSLTHQPLQYDSSINGTVTFTGALKPPKKLKLPGACAKQHDGDVYQNDIQLNKGKVRNTIVYISAGHEKLNSPPVPTTEVEIDQRGCIYVPRVIVARTGQPVTFINSDPIFHNVKANAKWNKRFNQGMPRKNQRMTKVFTKNEITVHASVQFTPGWVLT